jgi:hypothetical protein
MAPRKVIHDARFACKTGIANVYYSPLLLARLHS